MNKDPTTGDDLVRSSADSDGHALLDQLLVRLGPGVYHSFTAERQASVDFWPLIESGGKASAGRVAIAVLELMQDWSDRARSWTLHAILSTILSRQQIMDEADVVRFVTALRAMLTSDLKLLPLSLIITSLSRWHRGLASPLVDQSLLTLAGSLADGRDEMLTIREKLLNMLGVPHTLRIGRHEVWAEAFISAQAAMPAARHQQWTALFDFCASADGGSPSKKWLTKLAELIGDQALPVAEFIAGCLAWIPLVSQPAPEGLGEFNHPRHPLRICDRNQDILKGLAWASTVAQDPALGRVIAGLALSCYNKKIPGEGPRAPKIGNACVWALGEYAGMQGVAHLSYLKVRVRYGTAQKQIEKALNLRASRLGMTRDDLDEIGVPDYGLTAVGTARIAVGDYTACIQVEGTATATLTWENAQGKTQKSLPTALVQAHKDELKEIKGALSDILKMLPAQRDRLDSLFLREKSWSYSEWRERYGDHLLVGTLARRLIWELNGADGPLAFVPHAGRLILLDGSVCTRDVTMCSVRLWHPIGRDTREVLAWRERLAALGIVQPFKQAHREVYLLTDAERRTAVYSNRFAAHILRQHQFNALCGARGWKNKLRLMVDAEYPPAYKELPQYGLHVEFWIEGIGNDYRADTNDSGTFLHLSTDQVRYYRTNAQMNAAHANGGGYHAMHGGPPIESLNLADVPPLVLSETMRDVDLFVGVASVGNDPTWIDGGHTDQQHTYWRSYSFGDLSESAKSRKAVLEGIIPKLRIADRCTFDERFLRVRGDLREYKIHLGSGNIQMEPNNQYLCIVAKQSATASGERVMLPFEGDQTMSIILSKALLLADDRKIKDPTILSQIRQ